MGADSDIVVVFKGRDGGWRWHRLARNHAIVSTSGEAFSSRRNAIRAAKRTNPGIDVQAAAWKVTR